MTGLLFSSCQPKGEAMADLVLLNGQIWTVDPDRPEASAVAINQNRILAVGQDSNVKELIGPETKVINLKGAFVLPGFIDAHTHFLNGGFALKSVKLRDCRRREEFISRIAAKASELPSGAWIVNGDWDHEQFSPPELPRKEWIDAVTPNHPVCVNRFDGHMVLVNSLALKLAKIGRDTVSPSGGEIVKDSLTGEPTGILKDAACDLIYAIIPEPSLEEKLAAVRIALQEAASHGVTSIHDMSDLSSFEVYQILRQKGELTARLYVYDQISDLDNFLQLKEKSGSGDQFLRLAGLKGFIDGSLGSSTAYFFKPYSDEPGNCGLLASHMYPEGIMEKRLFRADQAGCQVAVHAIGDWANALILDLYQKVFEQNGPRDRRWRIEHAQHLQRDDMGRFGQLGLIASVQPYHAIDDGCWAEKKIGPERIETTYAFNSLLKSGATLAFGSDWTVAPLDPLAGIYAAVTRRTLDGRHPDGWIPEEKISVEEAIKGYTINAAYAEFSEREKGSVEPGKLADLVVLDRHILKIKPEEIKSARVLMTMVDGRIIFDRL
ncbi:MAG: amidohydrolase [Candidatus Saccharicenans sp.]|nr:amidohydrolase [Candidatus Saccharicenans sp.]